ncbi:breast cancer type 1 susceptibility protein [Lasius niger]|uniref:Breast cancer type 1 susceptibility protein n=1 Tax=Lasius niger TaxID=67767 RepID=A0A0J7KR30_LASNI|nr:breast cancer type 1 susceptibility protein [Lasius niger]
MAEQIRMSDINQLSETVKYLQKSLECTICLQLMTEPTKTRCGHSFCKPCIGKVLLKKNASCPLCNKNLNRRNVSKDDHLKACIEKFTNLITAIETDIHIDIMSYSKQPRDTRESCSYSAVNQSSRDSNKKDPEILIKEYSMRCANKPSTSQEPIIDNSSSSLNEKTKQLSDDHSPSADENDNAIFKVRTWLHNVPDELSPESNADLISNNDNELDTTDEIHDDKNDKSSRTNRRKVQKTIAYINLIDEDTDTSRVSKNAKAKQFHKVIKTTDSAAKSELKYKAIHARVHAKTSMRDASKSGVEGTNDQNNSSSTTANDQTRQILAIDDSITSAPTIVSSVQSSAMDWTRMIEFGKETKRGKKKRKMKKLNVSIEKNKKLPRIIKNVKLSQSMKRDLTRITVDHNMSKKENSQKQDAIDKNLDLSNAKVMASKASSEASTHNREESTKNKANISTVSLTNPSPETPLYVMLEEEGKRIPIINSNQVSNIISTENINKDSRASQDRCREKSAEIAAEHCDSLLSSPKRLTVLTPKKLNKSVSEHAEIIRDITQASVSNLESLSPFVTAKNRTPEPEKNNSTQRTLEEVACSQSLQSPISKARLSLKRKSGIGGNKKTDSPPLSQVSLINRLSIIEKDINDSRNVDSPVSNNDRVKFLQMGTMIRRRNVKYFYLNTTKREQSMPAQMQITSVYNIQQSISKSERQQYIANMPCNLARSPDRSNEPQDMIDITMMEDTRFVIQAVSKDAELSTASPRRKVSATSTPKRDIDHHLNREKTATIEDATEKSAQSLHKPLADNSAIQKISRVHSRTLNSIKLLSPDKDSQLKFLAIDSPMSEHGETRRAKRQQSELQKSVHTKGNNFSTSTMKNSHFAASTSKAQEPSVENSDKKRKRMRCTGDKELFDDGRNDDLSDSASDSGRRRIKLDRYSRSSKNAESGLDASKNRRSSSPNDQNVIEVIPLDSEEQDTHARKFKRILPISSSDTESESAEHVARNWKRPRTVDQSDQRNTSITDAPKEKCLSIRCPSEGKLTSQRQSVNQKSLTMRDSDMFESSSMFNSENIDYILQQSTRLNRGKISEEVAETSNDDIINRVLQINRSQSRTDACRPLDSAPRNNGTSQRKKNSREYLLQDNFDEIIANVELPQSNEDMIPCTNQPTSSNLKSRLLAKQRTSNRLAMTDESCGAAQGIPMLSASSTNDIFEYYSLKNVRRPATTATLENLGKEKGNVTANVGTIEKDTCRRITSKHNVSREMEKFFDESSPPARHINDSVQSTAQSYVDDGTLQRPIVVGDEPNLTTDSFFDSLMNVTQHQVQLEKFEEELFGSPANRNQGRTTKITLQEDPSTKFESGVTHVIVNTIGEKNAAKSTLKFLQGVAHRKWIVSYRWIGDCLEQRKLLDETSYEAMTYNDDIIDAGPRRSRLRKKDLFEGFTFCCVGPYLNVSPSQYQSLLLATGATVVDSLEALAKKEGMKGIVIQDGVHDDKIEHWYRTAKAAPISDGWIVDCIGNYKLFKLASYIHHLSLQDLCAIGFPQELIGDEEYSDDEE